MAAAPKTVVTYDLDSSRRDFQIPFEYLARKFVQVSLIGKDRKVLILNIDYRFTQRTLITTTRAWGPTDGYEMLEIRRYTSATERLVDFSDGSILRAYDLNTSQVQSLHIAEEGRDIATDTIGVNNDGNLDARGRKIVNLADGVNDGDAVTVRQQKTWAESALNQANRSKTEADRSKSEADRSKTQADRAEYQADVSGNQASLANQQADRSKSEADRSKGYSDTTLTGVSTINNTLTLATQQADRSKAEADKSKVSADASEVSNNASGVSAGKAATSALEASTYATQVKYGTVPLFSVSWWGGLREGIPQGYIPADGQVISRALYIDVTGNVETMQGTITDAVWTAEAARRGNWSKGDGSTTWRVPDLNGKSAGTMGAPFLRGDGTGCYIIKVFGAVNNSGAIDANQIGTELGLQSARIANVEALVAPVYVFATLFTPSSGGNYPVNIRLHWNDPQAVAGGITYVVGVGNAERYFLIPSNGVYDIDLDALSGANTSNLLYLFRERAGSTAVLSQGFAATDVTTMRCRAVIRLQAGDRIFAQVGAGQVHGMTVYTSIHIKKIGN